MSDEPRALVCTRLSDMRAMHPKQVEMICFECGHVVGIYPTGQRALREHPRIKIVCAVCATNSLKPDDDVHPAGNFKEILQEIHDSKPVGKA